MYLAYTTEKHEETAKEEVGANASRAAAAGAAPAHEVATEGREAEQEADEGAVSEMSMWDEGYKNQQ